MFHKKRLLILIPTLLLIPLLVGMIPLKLANKMAHGGTCSQSQGKQGCNAGHCQAHSLISYHHFDVEIVNSATPDQGLLYPQEALCAVPESFHPNIHSVSTPLRC